MLPPSQNPYPQPPRTVPAQLFGGPYDGALIPVPLDGKGRPLLLILHCPSAEYVIQRSRRRDNEGRPAYWLSGIRQKAPAE